MLNGYSGSGWSMPNTVLAAPSTAIKRIADISFLRGTIFPSAVSSRNTEFLRSA